MQAQLNATKSKMDWAKQKRIEWKINGPLD